MGAPEVTWVGSLDADAVDVVLDSGAVVVGVVLVDGAVVVDGLVAGPVELAVEVWPVGAVVGEVVAVVPPLPVSVLFDWPKGRDPVTPDSELAMNHSD